MPIISTLAAATARASGFLILKGTGVSGTGTIKVEPAVNGVTFWDFDLYGALILDGANDVEYKITALTSTTLITKMWGQGGQGSYGGQGGYSAGEINVSTNDVYTAKLNTGGGPSNPGSGSGTNRGERGGGYAGIFYGTAPGISQPNARIIAGGGGGGAPPVGGSGSATGGGGGGPSGGNGGNSPDSVTGSSGGSGGTQGGAGGGGSGSGSPGASPGSTLQGGTGGQGSGSFPNWSGGGGGGAGYYGGGGGGGGDDYGEGTRAASGGGGGSGYIHPSVTNSTTSTFTNGPDPQRGTAGNANTNSRIVIKTQKVISYIASNNQNTTYNVTVPADATSMTAKVWGSGGAGVGENCGGPYSGGSGGYVQGTIPVNGGSVQILIGASGQGSQAGLSGFGAGDGGYFSTVSYGANLLVAGGGGGAGQAGNGGYGGGNASGGTGTSSANSAYIGQGGTQSSGGIGGSGFAGANAGGTGTAYPGLGGSAGGTGVGQGNRGGGGGAGYYGGGGGGGGDFVNANCQSGGAGGGSGIISGSWSNTSSQNGQTGTSGGRSATNSGDPNYVPGYGGSSQNGLVVLIFR